MKKMLIISLAACFIIMGMLIILPGPAHSATLGIGAAGWYTWWDPRPDYREAEADPDFMYGPQLLLQFAPAWSFSSVFLYGKFTYLDEEGGSMTIDRYDSDTTFSYSLSQYIRIFSGLKFMGYDYQNGKHLGLGPGLGLGFVVPLMENTFCSLSVSGMYLWGEQSDSSNDGDSSFNFIEYGVNNSISLIYIIPSSSVSLSLGGRYFFFKFEATDKGMSEIQESHHFYGITASAMYMISL